MPVQFNKPVKNKVPDRNTLLLTTYFEVFPPELFDPLTMEYKGFKLAAENKDEKEQKIERENFEKEFTLYIKRPFTVATSFFGLPSSYYNKDDSVAELLIKNLAGWKTGDTFSSSSIPISLFNILKNTLFSIYKTVFNTAKLFTEFLPMAAANLLKAVALKAENKENSVLYAAAMAGHVFFHAVAFVGRAITSPIQGVRFALSVGEKVEKALGGESVGSKIAGAFVGGLLAGISLAITGVAMTFAVKFFAPAIVAKLHSIPWLNPILTKAAHVLGLDQVAVHVTYAIKLKLEALHAAILIGAPALTLAGTIADRAWNKVKNWWDSTKKKENGKGFDLKDDEDEKKNDLFTERKTLNLESLSYKELLSKIKGEITIPAELEGIKKIGKNFCSGEKNQWTNSVNPEKIPEQNNAVTTRTWKDKTGKPIFAIRTLYIFNETKPKKGSLIIENLQTKESVVVKKAANKI